MIRKCCFFTDFLPISPHFLSVIFQADYLQQLLTGTPISTFDHSCISSTTVSNSIKTQVKAPPPPTPPSQNPHGPHFTQSKNQSPSNGWGWPYLTVTKVLQVPLVFSLLTILRHVPSEPSPPLAGMLCSELLHGSFTLPSQ